ncbi:ABC transporter permease [Rhodococcus sp. Eu-32]|uniref:ABC transporter permease n=1 Tax=Rhodococcus sp. Eu-32 TaxID=1017319 RepID=UPI000DF3786E|nr:ABC transporter permease [Rhodococcus sp. Eu-32]RRQ26581.1 ABC transporter permease [Rhodococcus sp. Eu-32]
MSTALDVVVGEAAVDSRPPRRRRTGVAGRVFSASMLSASIAIVALVVLWALVPSLFTDQDPLLGVGAEKLQPPSGAHWFGTDQVGRDLFARIVYGASLSLTGAVIAVVLALVVGSLLGLLAGFVGGRTDDIIMRGADVMLSIPSILLSMAIITVLGRGVVVVAVAVGIASIASIARTMRSEVLKVRVADYTDAARAAGVRWWTIMFAHVLPNARGPVVVLATIEFGTALLAIAGLSFLGYGEPAPAPEWGALISTGRDYMATSWWLITIPGLVIVAVVLSLNRVSHALQDRKSFTFRGRKRK